MKKGAIASIGLLLIIFYINGCGIINRGADPELENDPSAFHADDHQQGEGFGFWNQQKDKKNPIANMVTRDERPGRGMNGIVDQHPTAMKKRISRFEAKGKEGNMNMVPNLGGYDHLGHSQRDEGNKTEQISLELIQRDTVRDARIFAYKNELLIVVDSEAKDTEALRAEITDYLKTNFPTKEITVVTERKIVDRIRLLENGYRSGQSTEDYGIELRKFFNEANANIEGQFR